MLCHKMKIKLIGSPRDEERGKERILGTAAWLPPGYCSHFQEARTKDEPLTCPRSSGSNRVSDVISAAFPANGC